MTFFIKIRSIAGLRFKNKTIFDTTFMDNIKTYFPGLTPEQFDRLSQLWPIYKEWNRKINVISRKDIDFFYLRHVLHSLSVMKVVHFKPQTRIMDVGTGGGFPGIPLAICFPDCHFLLVDSIGKKIKVVNEVKTALGLDNVEAIKARAETVNRSFDFIVSRAVKSLPVFMSWVSGKVSPEGFNELPNGVLYLKGGDFSEELAGLRFHHRIYELSAFFDDPFFDTKKLVHIFSSAAKKHFDKRK